MQGELRSQKSINYSDVTMILNTLTFHFYECLHHWTATLDTVIQIPSITPAIWLITSDTAYDTAKVLALVYCTQLDF